MKARKAGDRINYRCPCGHLHSITVEGPNAWGWNGSLDSPTFTPSVLYKTETFPSGSAFGTDDEVARALAGEKLVTPFVCHSFVRDGKVEFLADCTHPLAGKTVELADWA